MKNILSKLKISNYTYIFILLCLLCGYIKNISIIFFICIFHELGHIIFIKLFKYEIITIEILPFGGYTTINKKINSSINKDILIAFGGIFNQILLFMIINIFKNYINIITYNLIYNYNLILLVFNLLPIIPLDGNNIVHLLLEKHFSYQLSYYINYSISLFFLVIFILINYIYKLDNYFIILFLLYKLILDINNYKYLKNRFLLERCLFTFSYYKIDNHTNSINDLKKEVYHYFKGNNKYKKESQVILSCLSNRSSK